MGKAFEWGFAERAEDAGFEFMITADKNMRYQQNLASRKIALVVIGNAQWPILRRYVGRVVTAVETSSCGSFIEVDIPFQ